MGGFLFRGTPQFASMSENIQLGLKENRKQFLLLLLINAFVGGMVGLERSVLPEVAEREFGLVAKTAILSFLIVFGLSKAISNYFAGTLADRYGRKRLLVLGWLVALPIPFMLMFATHWNQIVLANLFLGINQGLCWSSTVIMKIDLVGTRQRGFAMGLNEFSGYLAVAAIAFLTAWIADEYGLRPYVFYPGVLLVLLGLLFSVFFVRDTRSHVILESDQSALPVLEHVFRATTWKDKVLSTVTQAGLVNNLNDSMVWGLLPLLLLNKQFSLEETGLITAVYPAVWGFGQLFTGRMADRYPKKDLLFLGMLLQAVVLFLLVFAVHLYQYVILSALLGWGTAMVYPTFLATIADHTHPSIRAESIGVFRLWRDLGYALGAVLTGLLADFWGISVSVVSIGLITLFSALLIAKRMP